MNSPNKLSVVIPIFNQSHLTERCLKSLFAHSSQVVEVVVVNNASNDKTNDVLERMGVLADQAQIRFEIVNNAENRGFGRACNQGIRKLHFESAPGMPLQNHFAVILNNDTWLMNGWDRALTEKASSLRLGCIGPYFYEGAFDEKDLYRRSEAFVMLNGHKTRNHFVPILMCFTAEAILKLRFDHGGIFDERFFVTYEDADLKVRMEQAKVKYAQTGACFIWHHSMGSRKSLPSGYEQEGHRVFLEKWGFDPREHHHTLLGKLKRGYWKLKEKYGMF